VADDLLARFSPARVVVRVSKPAARPGGLDATPSISVSRP
jgi:dihydroneopterin aldolase